MGTVETQKETDMLRIDEHLRGAKLDGWLSWLIGEAVHRTAEYDRTVRDARRVWRDFRRERGFVNDAKIMTYPENQAKLGKSETFTLGLTLQHANVAGIEMCQWRTKACTATCVLDTGNGRYDVVQRARNVRTWFLVEHPRQFLTLVFHEIATVADQYDDVLVRLNVNSDVSWFKLIPSMFNGWADNVSFYDYTKNPSALDLEDGMVNDRYRLVYSLSERDRTTQKMDRVRDYVARGGTVAVVTVRSKTDAPASSFMGMPVVDGDAHDDRFNERGVFVDLYAKGKARKLPVGGFVRDLGSN